MYYFKGIGFGLAMAIVLLAIMYFTHVMGFGSQVVELGAYIFMVVALGIIGFRFKGQTKLSLIQLFQTPEATKYLYFPFGVSTVTALTQATTTFMSEGDSLVFWLIPVAVIGQGLGLSAFILLGMWCNRGNA